MVRTHATDGTRTGRLSARSSAWKPLLLALLAFNTVYYAVAGTTSKAVDAAAWLVLLVLFELEARLPSVGGRAKTALRIARLIAAAGVFAATAGYLFEDNALDAMNSALWIAVVVLLEIEFRRPALVARRRRVFTAMACTLYGGLTLLVLAWAWRREYFDAYDALLWLVAFATIEYEAADLTRG
jgi:hypothetical protein